MTLEEIRKDWEKRYPEYEELSRVIAQYLEERIKEKGFLPRISYRAKETVSLLKKIMRKGCSYYEEMTDKAGVRVVVDFFEQLRVVEEIIETTFKVIKREDKRESLDFNQMDYQAIHFDVMLKNDIPLKTPDFFCGKICEVQLKTKSQDLWSEMYHVLAYKNEQELPKDIKRSLHCLNALLEIIDKQFNKIKKDISLLPATTTYSVLNLLEKNFYKFVVTQYDKLLSLEIINCLLPLYESNTIEATITSFVEENKEKLGFIYKQYSDDKTRHLLLYQPESLMIFERLDKSKFKLLEQWASQFPPEELEGLAIAWGDPYQYY